jgi:hypothetical protein
MIIHLVQKQRCLAVTLSSVKDGEAGMIQAGTHPRAEVLLVGLPKASLSPSPSSFSSSSSFVAYEKPSKKSRRVQLQLLRSQEAAAALELGSTTFDGSSFKRTSRFELPVVLTADRTAVEVTLVAPANENGGGSQAWVHVSQAKVQTTQTQTTSLNHLYSPSSSSSFLRASTKLGMASQRSYFAEFDVVENSKPHNSGGGSNGDGGNGWWVPVFEEDGTQIVSITGNFYDRQVTNNIKIITNFNFVVAGVFVAFFGA